MSREAKFQVELVDLFKNVIGRYRFDSLELSDVERDYPVDRKEADIVVFKSWIENRLRSMEGETIKVRNGLNYGRVLY